MTRRITGAHTGPPLDDVRVVRILGWSDGKVVTGSKNWLLPGETLVDFLVDRAAPSVANSCARVDDPGELSWTVHLETFGGDSVVETPARERPELVEQGDDE